jgi:hypothetical protein
LAKHYQLFGRGHRAIDRMSKGRLKSHSSSAVAIAKAMLPIQPPLPARCPFQRYFYLVGGLLTMRKNALAEAATDTNAQTIATA